MPNTKGKPKRTQRGKRSNGPSRTPSTTLTRTFRYVKNIQLNNSSGSGLDQYSYFSKYFNFEPKLAVGFRDAQSTFELWRMKNAKVSALPGYNSYNQTYNTINSDAAQAIMVWTAADLGANETISGVSLQSYNNAVCNTLSYNSLKPIVNTKARINTFGSTPRMIMPSTTWLDTAADTTTVSYSGFQMFAQMYGLSATAYLPKIQLIFEIEVEFKQPAYQNRPTLFEAEFVGSTLKTIPDATLPDEFRTYKVSKYILRSVADGGNEVVLAREDGLPGFLLYTQEEFFNVYVNGSSGKYHDDRRAIYTGPIPRKPINWVPSN